MKLLNEMKGVRDSMDDHAITDAQWAQFEREAKEMGILRELLGVRAAHDHLLMKLDQLVTKAQKENGRPVGVNHGPPPST